METVYTHQNITWNRVLCFAGLLHKLNILLYADRWDYYDLKRICNMALNLHELQDRCIKLEYFGSTLFRLNVLRPRWDFTEVVRACSYET